MEAVIWFVQDWTKLHGSQIIFVSAFSFLTEFRRKSKIK